MSNRDGRRAQSNKPRSSRWRINDLTDSRLWEFLEFHGYGSSPEPVEHALARYQTAHGLRPTGGLTRACVRLMSSKRCCHSERSNARPDQEARWKASSYRALTLASTGSEAEPELAPDEVGVSGFEPIPARWRSRSLRFAFAGGAPSLQ